MTPGNDMRGALRTILMPWKNDPYMDAPARWFWASLVLLVIVVNGLNIVFVLMR